MSLSTTPTPGQAMQRSPLRNCPSYGSARMERVIQLLDDLDDFMSTLGLLSERIRNGLVMLLSTLFVLAIQVGGVLLALAHPPLALAAALLLFVSLLYRAVTSSHQPLEIA